MSLQNQQAANQHDLGWTWFNMDINHMFGMES